jgi:hypothetical protein
VSAASLRQRTGAHGGGRGNSNRQHVAAAICIGNVLEDLLCMLHGLAIVLQQRPN